MPQKIIKQPDGRYAIFSTVVDNFTMVNASEEEVRQDLKTYHSFRDETIEKIIAAGRDDLDWFEEGPREVTPHGRYMEALERILGVHGPVEMLKKWAQIEGDGSFKTAVDWFKANVEKDPSSLEVCAYGLVAKGYYLGLKEVEEQEAVRP